MTASAKDELMVDCGVQDALARANAALVIMGAALIEPTPGAVAGKMGFSVRSVGEIVRVETVALADKKTRLAVTSTSTVSTTLIAWGKHKQNITDFKSAFAALPPTMQSTRPAAAPPPQQPAAPAANAPTIFISYRREDSADVTGRIYDRLIANFTPQRIFKDVDSIGLGHDFRSKVGEALDHCAAFLAVIGPVWAGPTGNGFRLNEPNDWVRLEVETALKKGIPIVPLFVRGAKMPLESDLPLVLQPLVYRNGLNIRPDPDFRNDMERLSGALRALMERHPQSSA